MSNETKHKLLLIAYILIILFLVFTAPGCTDITEPSPELKKAKAEEHERYLKGPKHQSGCYKIINKKHHNYGCTFQSTQGSMFLSTPGGQNTAYRDYNSGKGDAISAPGQWHLIWNRRIKCLDDDAFLGFIGQDDVKKITCPEYLYYDEPKRGRK